MITTSRYRLGISVSTPLASISRNRAARIEQCAPREIPSPCVASSLTETRRWRFASASGSPACAFIVFLSFTNNAGLSALSSSNVRRSRNSFISSVCHSLPYVAPTPILDRHAGRWLTPRLVEKVLYGVKKHTDVQKPPSVMFPYMFQQGIAIVNLGL